MKVLVGMNLSPDWVPVLQAAGCGGQATCHTLLLTWGNFPRCHSLLPAPHPVPLDWGCSFGTNEPNIALRQGMNHALVTENDGARK